MPRISEFQLLQRASSPTLTIRTHTRIENLPTLIGESYDRIAAYMGELGIHPANVPFVAYHNMDMQNLDVEIGFAIAEPVPDKGDIVCRTTSAGTYVFCMYQGPYSAMEPTYTEMGAWMMENGFEPTGAAYEYYYNSPEETQELLLTQIVMPIKQYAI